MHSCMQTRHTHTLSSKVEGGREGREGNMKEGGRGGREAGGGEGGRKLGREGRGGMTVIHTLI